MTMSATDYEMPGSNNARNEPLNRDAILEGLETKRFGREILVLDNRMSTNDVANKLAAEAAPEGFVVLAEEQSAGRGTHGQTWLSPRSGLWMTLILRPPIESQPLNGLPLIGALAVARTIQSMYDVRALVRWPNDVVIRDRKLAGVMAEAKLLGNSPAFILLGIGLNANFPTEQLHGLAERSTSLLDLLGSPE